MPIIGIIVIIYIVVKIGWIGCLFILGLIIFGFFIKSKMDNNNRVQEGIAYRARRDGIERLRKEKFVNVGVDALSGGEFEEHCAGILKNQGWTVTMTPKTGDYGVDIIAVKRDIKMAVQCKRSSSPVGNGAVQEVYSGKKFYSANCAIVVSNNTYTAATEETARKCDITLLSHNDLGKLDRATFTRQN